jgi:erythronate-4-phosphate dehydrogenase
MLKLIIDENIAFADEAFNQFGVVKLLSGREIQNRQLKDADILIIRSVTDVNKNLLNNTTVKFVGTATIGRDHIDLDYLDKNKIVFADAKGCNAFSVAEYVITALINLSVRFDFKLSEKSIGIVGVGNVGKKVAQFAKAFGMKVLLNDPPRQRTDNKNNFVDLDEILTADIITLHVPLNLVGIDKTHHLFNEEKLSKVNDGSIIINTSRGSVINNKALLKVISKKKLKVVLDVWENEPDINIELLKHSVIATPHIAGYSVEGKINGTKMIYNSLCEFLSDEKIFPFETNSPSKSGLYFNDNEKLEVSLDKLILQIYSIKNDDEQMRKIIYMKLDERIKYFDELRKNYPARREFDNYTCNINPQNRQLKNILEILRFEVT